MKLKKTMLSIMIAAMGLLSVPTKAQENNMMPDIKSWPEASQMAAKEMMDKYGKPNETTPSMLVWYNNGPWKKTTIYNMETKHLFPIDHTDVMEQVIDHRVPTNKLSALGEFDGSVRVQRTDGEISAKCDSEGANFLALNLAHDVLTGKKTVQAARDFYTKTIKEFVLDKKPSPYMKSLQFAESKGDTGFTDKNSVSNEVMEKIKKEKMKMKIEKKEKM
jgi:hypothetical protein